MAVSQSALEKILSGARALCNPEGDRMINEYQVKGADRDYFEQPDPNDFVESYSDYGEVNEQKTVLATQAPTISSNKLKNSNIPAAIRESFAKKQIDTSRLSNVSVLDQMSEEAKNKIASTAIRVEKRNQPQMVNENVMPRQSGFDYTALKAVVKECIAEYFEKHPINENTLSGIKLSGGKIYITDNQNRRFSAKLVLENNTENDD